MSEDHYEPSDIPQVRPEFVRRGPWLYQGNVKVQHWQLTLEERMKYFPEQFPNLDAKKVACPFPECGKMVNDPMESGGKQSIVNHFRTAHERWWLDNKRKLENLTSYSDIRALVRGESP